MSSSAPSVVARGKPGSRKPLPSLDAGAAFPDGALLPLRAEVPILDQAMVQSEQILLHLNSCKSQGSVQVPVPWIDTIWKSAFRYRLTAAWWALGLENTRTWFSFCFFLSWNWTSLFRISMQNRISSLQILPRDFFVVVVGERGKDDVLGQGCVWRSCPEHVCMAMFPC